MKKLIEKAVPDDVDIINYITALAIEDPCWINLSHDLCLKMQDTYYHREKIAGNGGKVFFKIDKESSSLVPMLYVECTPLDNWGKVASFGERSIACLALDPEIIYFLY